MNFTDFGNDKTIDTLNAMTIAEVIVTLGSPSERIAYADVPGWRQGDGRPDLASDEPAVMQAIGRCAAFKARQKYTAPLPVLRVAHPSTCGWCGYPLDELVKACAWAAWQSRFVTAHVLEWTNEEGRKYARPGDSVGYQHPEWRRFWELAPKERERRIETATGRTALIEEKKP